jgi:cytoskeletal protein RodZ
MAESRTTELIGQRLREKREARHISVEQVATSLRIRLRYVEAMDKGDFDIFPSPVQARGFLRSYIQYLNLDAEPYLAALDGDPSILEAGVPDRPSREEQDAESAGGSPRPPTGELLSLAGAGQDQAPDVSPGEPPAGGNPALAQGADGARPRSTPAAGYPRTIFEEIGQTLRVQRETLGLSLGDIERHTRLRAFYLKALEAGDLDGLPSPVQGRGMLKNYASFLGLDGDALLLQFAEGLQARLAARQGPHILKRTGRVGQYAPMGSPQPRLITTDLLLAGVLIVFLIAFVAWGAIRISAMRSGLAPTATAPAIADVLAQAGTPTLEPLAPGVNILTASAQAAAESTGELQAAPTADITQVASITPPPEFGSASVQVIISVRLRTWMRVSVDGKVEFEGRVQAGSAFPFAGDESVEILTGNGAGLEVNFNQTDLGALGTFGEAVQRVFTVQGMQTPTATITRTPAPVTVTPTLTPSPPPP